MAEFATMVSDHIPNLRRYARVLVRDAVHAEDLVQDCLERAISREHLWRQGTNLRAWLFTILHNLYINQYLRHGSVGTVVPLLEEHALVSCPARQFHSVTLADLARAFDDLPKQEQQVVLLVGLEGMQYEDAAEALGVPMGTVKSRLSRARRRLRKLMDGDLRSPKRGNGRPPRIDPRLAYHLERMMGGTRTAQAGGARDEA